MDISIVIPNYNGEKIIKNNLPKVFEALNDYKFGKIEVIVVDDASTDNSVREIEKLKINNFRLKVFKNKKNLGFSSTVNRGVKEASGEVVVLLNTDVIPEKNFLMPIIKHFDNEKVFAVGCLDKSLEEGKIVLRGRGIGQWRKGFLIHSRGEIDKSNTLWVAAGSGAFRKSLWDKLEGLDEVYNPFYWEDIDISYRALKSGYTLIFEPESIVIHEHKKGAIKSKYSSFEIKTTSYRNQFIFVWKNTGDFNLKLSHVAWLPYHFAKALARRDWVFFLGFFKAFILLPKIIKSRLRTHKNFQKTDKEVINQFIE